MVKYRKCAVVTCDDRQSPRHRFPNPRKFKSRFERWIELCGDKDLHVKNADLVYRSHRICDRHFLVEDRSSNMLLKKDVLPSLFLPLHFPVSDSNLDPVSSQEDTVAGKIYIFTYFSLFHGEIKTTFWRIYNYLLLQTP